MYKYMLAHGSLCSPPGLAHAGELLRRVVRALPGPLRRWVYSVRATDVDLQVMMNPWRSLTTGPKDHLKIRILQTMVSGIPLVLGLKTRM